MRFLHTFLLLFTILGVRASHAQELGNLVISGHVREEGSNGPIAAATLEISRSGGLANAPVTFGIEGEFLFHGLGEGEYVISAKKNGFDSASVTVSVMHTGAPEAEALRTAGEDSIYYATRLRGASNGRAKQKLGFAPRKLEWLSKADAALRAHPS
jgi:Carboxypeptidase regulatory-like domain